ncbi:protease I [Peptoclostridium litorale DSM 5388]|uniref:Intracellular protease, PfpI family n=1 Tax=Peptoclostridium litorale DSM 5388 TaxID=1121324 RepID=A0A069RDU4_PEPLI|nr:type 1 glutamine amidotransferase domain-containing protein [Peptoclostridium litorale]KDR94375.1 intracellular protease, PfpI family [Peptoclostridium litorale DSM 5388]SIO24926.1 protease I [Peptoclostridium litorale DSM 5388]
MKERKIAIIAEDEFEDLELYYPYFRLIEAGFRVEIAGVADREYYKGKNNFKIKKDVNISDVDPSDYEGVIVPGGWAPDRIRRNKNACEFIRGIYESDKLVASICHGPWVLISSKVVKDHVMTSTKAIRDDIENAGAKWVDKSVVRDKNIITSRNPHDLPVFMKEILLFLS